MCRSALPQLSDTRKSRASTGTSERVAKRVATGGDVSLPRFERNKNATRFASPRTQSRALWCVGFALCFIAAIAARAFERGTVVRGGDFVVVTSLAPQRGVDASAVAAGSRIEVRMVLHHRASAKRPARDVTVREDLRAHLETLLFRFVPDAYGARPGYGLQIRAPHLNAGRATPLSNISDDDAGAYDDGVIVLRGIHLQPGESASLRFQVDLL